MCYLAIFVILLSMLYRKSKTGVLYLAIAAPLMTAGFIEVKYLPHFGVAYLVLFGILLGELLYLAESKWKLSEYGKQDRISPAVYQNAATVAYVLLMIGAFFILGSVAAIAFFMAFAIYLYFIKQEEGTRHTPG